MFGLQSPLVVCRTTKLRGWERPMNLLPEIVSTGIDFAFTAEHNGHVAIRTSDANIGGWLWAASELQRPINFTIACAAASQGKNIRVRYRSFDGTGFHGCEVIGVV